VRRPVSVDRTVLRGRGHAVRLRLHGRVLPWGNQRLRPVFLSRRCPALQRLRCHRQLEDVFERVHLGAVRDSSCLRALQQHFVLTAVPTTKYLLRFNLVGSEVDWESHGPGPRTKIA
jgi:hypothetical protein